MKKKIIILSLMLFFLGGVTFATKTYSRYQSQSASEAPVNIATLIFDDNRETTFNLKLDDMVPGSVKEYPFDVVNFEGNNISKTVMDYEIAITKSNNIPLTVKLLKGDSLTTCLDNNLICAGRMGIAEKQTDSYKLVIEWSIEDNSYEYNGLTDYLDINISAVQKIS